jgi:hypothetical protein
VAITFPLDIRTELNLGGAWVDVSSDVYLRDTKQITRGVRDQGTTADPSTLTFTLNNKDGKYSPRNAMSPLYGLTNRNTPVRLSLPGTGDSYLQLDGQDGNVCSTPDKAALDLTGDLDIRWEGEANWYGQENQVLIGKWDDASDQCSWLLNISQGTMFFQYSTTGAQATSTAFMQRDLPILPTRAALRATVHIDTTAQTATFTFYYATVFAGPYTAFDGGSTVVNIGTAHNTVKNSTAPLSIGLTDFRHGQPGARSRHPLVGRCYRAEVRNGISGPVVASPDFRALGDQATSTTDAQGNVWTLKGNAEIRNREDRFVGEISRWPLAWSADDADVWTSVTASGLLRRMGQGNKPLDSTLRRRIPSGTPLAYWPCEESQDATVAYSPIPGVRPALLTNVDWASQDSLPSSLPLPTLHPLSVLDAHVPGVSTTGQWQVEYVYNAFGKVPPSAGNEAPIGSVFTTGSVVRWDFTAKSTVAHIYGYDDNGVQVVNQPIGIGDDIFNGWVRVQFHGANNSDGTYTVGINWQDVGGDAGGFAVSGTGTVGYVNRVYCAWTALNDGWGFGHLYVLPTLNQSFLTGSDNAYNGDGAYARMLRLATEEDFSLERIPGSLLPLAVGFQRPDALLTLVEAAADADGGLLTETSARLGLRYRDRSSMYSQAPALTLSYTDPGLGPDLQPVDDDTNIFNDITVQRDGGSSFRAFLASGPMSIADPPVGIGKYDTSYTVSLADDSQPEPVANWRLHLSTFDGARYPVVSLLLHKPGADVLIPDTIGLREGDKIRLTNLPQWVSNNDVDLIVMGWSETLDMYTWQIDFNCIPADPWEVATLDANLTADAEGATLATAMGTTTTTASVSGPLWSADPAQLPWDISVGGERMTVQAVGTILNGNSDFAANVTGWSGLSGASVAWSSAQAKSGNGSALLTTGTLAGPRVEATSVAVTVGQQYRASGWLYAFQALPLGAAVSVNWYTSTGTYISTSTNGAVPTVGAWQFYDATFTAPATAAKAGVFFTCSGTPGTGLKLYGDLVKLTPVSTYATSPQTLTVTRSVNGVVKAQTSGTAVALADTPIIAL